MHKLTADEEKRSPHRELQPGEWQLWCADCGFRFPKNAAAKPVCPECESRRIFLAEPKPELR